MSTAGISKWTGILPEAFFHQFRHLRRDRVGKVTQWTHGFVTSNRK